MTEVLAPDHVHQYEQRIPGLPAPHWTRRRYDGGPYDESGHRICSYCGSMHPDDLHDLVHSGRARIEGTTKSYKRYIVVPNPIAGRECRVGSRSGPIRYEGGAEPQGLVARMLARVDREASGVPDGHRIGVRQRMRGRWSAETRGVAPAELHAKFYMNHVTLDQWEAIVA